VMLSVLKMDAGVEDLVNGIKIFAPNNKILHEDQTSKYDASGECQPCHENCEPTVCLDRPLGAVRGTQWPVTVCWAGGGD
jgi:hypothetical protein